MSASRGSEGGPSRQGLNLFNAGGSNFDPRSDAFGGGAGTFRTLFCSSQPLQFGTGSQPHWNRANKVKDAASPARRREGLWGKAGVPKRSRWRRARLPHSEITLKEISAWSLATLAVIAVGLVLYAAREIMLPVVAAFVVGAMLGPAARRLDALHVPRALTALLLVAGLTLIIALVILLIFPRVSELTYGLPGIVGSLKEKLHVFDGLVAAWRRLAVMIGEPNQGRRRASVARDFLGPFDRLNSDPDDYGISVLSRRAAAVHLGMAEPPARPRHDLREPRFPADGAQDPERNRILAWQLSFDRRDDQFRASGRWRGSFAR